MKPANIVIAFILIIVIVFGIHPRAAEAQRKVQLTGGQIAQKFKSSVFRLNTDKGTATCFWLEPGLLVTNYHVIVGAKRISVATSSETISANRLLGFDAASDLALLMPAKGFGKFAPVGDSSKVNVGDKLFVIGSPRGLDHTLTEGILSAKRTEGGITYLQLSAPVSPGSSGSPVINTRGEVVGVIVGGLKDSQQLNFAVTIECVRDRSFGIPLFMVSSLGGGDNLPISRTESEPGVLDPISAIEVMDSAGGFDLNYRELAFAPDFPIVLEAIPDALGSEVSLEDVDTWIQAELARSAPNAKIITIRDQLTRIKRLGEQKTLIGRMIAEDAYRRNLHVSIGYMKDSDGTSFYTVDIDFQRGGLTPTGPNTVGSYQAGSHGYFGSAYKPSDKLRDAVTKLIREFADKWVVANKPITSTP